MASLLSIPLEILVAISANLSTIDLGSLRLVCKQTEKSLYEWFSREFFSKKQFMFTHESLQAFVDIAKHAGFSKTLGHVVFGTNQYNPRVQSFRDTQSEAKFMQGSADQLALLYSSLDREMLTEAFASLKNLEVVGIRDFNANSRYRDGAFASWRSWGSRIVETETGQQMIMGGSPYVMEEGGDWLTARILMNVLYALGKSGRTVPQIEILLRNRPLPETALTVPDFLVPTLAPVLEGLKVFLVSVDLTGLPHFIQSGQKIDPSPGLACRRFLSLTPNLTHLRLNFTKLAFTENYGFLEWLGETPDPNTPCRHTTPPIRLPSLARLELGQLSTEPQLLLAIIAKFASTLRSLSLWKVDLSFRITTKRNIDDNAWMPFFKCLRNMQNLRLTHLLVGMLNQDHMYVKFKTGVDGATTDLKQQQYSGRDMAKFLDALVEQVYVDRPAPIQTFDDLGDEDHDEYEDEDEEMSEHDSEDDHS